MARRTAIPAILAALALTASAACSNGSADKGSAGANPTLATDPPTTTTTNPYAVPAVIDVAYVNRVLAGLDAVKGDATRELLRSKTITNDVFDRMRAVYDSNEFLQLTIDGLEADVRERFTSYQPIPGNVASNVSKLITGRSDCVFAQVQRDYSKVGVRPSQETSMQWVALKPLNRLRDPRGLNPTYWAFTYDGVPRDRSQPQDPCAG